jgi:hypothetical protein
MISNEFSILLFVDAVMCLGFNVFRVCENEYKEIVKRKDLFADSYIGCPVSN